MKANGVFKLKSARARQIHTKDHLHSYSSLIVDA